MASEIWSVRQDTVELECVEADQETPHSADVLLRRGRPKLTRRMTSSDHSDDQLEDDDDDEGDDDDEEECPGHTTLNDVSKNFVIISILKQLAEAVY